MAAAGFDKVHMTQAITRIRTSSLFGRYDYVLPSERNAVADPRLIILYGDNGSGKTTFLRLVHHMLSPGPGRGHKTAISQIPFKEFSISFANGYSFCAKREGNLVGSYALFLYKSGNDCVASAKYILDEESKIPR